MKKHFFLSIILTIFVSGLSFAQNKPQAILVAEIGGGGRVKTASVPRIDHGGPLVRRDENYSLEKQTFEILNAERSTRGLEPLVWDERVAQLARLHSRSMAAEKFFSHRGPDGSTVDARADQLGLSTWTAIAENIAFLKGQGDPAQLAVERWLASASHRRNILGGGWERSAIGVAAGQDGALYFTQVFISGV